MLTKYTDNKGRVTLGEKFANRTVIIRAIDETEVTVTLARIVPEREAWLHENPAAKAAVIKGIEQSEAGQLVDGPDLEAGEKLVQEIEADDVHSEMDNGCNRPLQPVTRRGGASKTDAGSARKPKVVGTRGSVQAGAQSRTTAAQ